MAPEERDLIHSLREHAEELAAANPVLGELRKVGQFLLSEARSKWGTGSSVSRLGALLMVDGTPHLVNLPSDAEDVKVCFEAMRTAAKDQRICAAAVLSTVARQIPTVEGQTIFFEIHTEHRSGLVTVAGIPADEHLAINGVNGAAVLRYSKRAAPFIFVELAK